MEKKLVDTSLISQQVISITLNYRIAISCGVDADRKQVKRGVPASNNRIFDFCLNLSIFLLIWERGKQQNRKFIGNETAQ